MNTKSKFNPHTAFLQPKLLGGSPRSRCILAAAALFFAIVAPAFAQTVFTSGDLVVSTYGAGGGFIDGVPTPISLEEFTTSGALVTTLTLPTADSGSNLGMVGEYGSSSEANLQLSGDGHSLLISGYQATAAYANIGGPAQGGYSDANGTALAQSVSTDVPRVVAIIGANGVVNSTTQVNNLYSTNNPRSVWSANGTTLYTSGQGGGSTDQGVFTFPAGTNMVANPTGPAPVPISSNTGLSTRIVSAYNGNMYYSVDVKNVATGIYEYTGIPTSAASATQILPASGLSGNSANVAVNYSPDGFYFANATTLYVADTGAPKNKALGNGGIQKWTFNGSTWVLDYTLTPSNFVLNFNDSKKSAATDGEVGFESITGQVVGGMVQLYAVSYTIGDADKNGLYSVSDLLVATTNPGDTFTEIASAPGIGSVSDNTTAGGAVFKSVSFAPSAVPEPGAFALIFGTFSSLLVMFFRRRRKKTLPTTAGDI